MVKRQPRFHGTQLNFLAPPISHITLELSYSPDSPTYRTVQVRRDWPILVLLAAVTFAVFWRVHRHEFVNYDDYAYVTLNPMVQQGFSCEGLVWAFGQLHGESTYWHPLTWMSHMLDCQLFGLKPGAHHLVSVFFHTLNTVLLFVLLRRLTGRRWCSAMVAALFALHPLQVDSVAWVAERKNVLSTLFWILALLAYLRYAAKPGWARYSLVFLLMALGLMAKPILVTLPCVMLLLDFWPLGRLRLFQRQPASIPGQDPQTGHLPSAHRPFLHPFLEKLPLLALSAVSSIVTIQGHQALGALVPVERLSLSARLDNALVAYAMYLRKLIWPVDLSVFYLHPGGWPTPTIAVSAFLLIAITTLAIQQSRRRPYLLVGWLWFLGTLVPTIGLIQAHEQSMADRFAYVPLIGIFIMVVWLMADSFQSWPRRQLLQGAAAGLALAGCVVMTSLQLRYWRNSLTLVQRAVELAPDNHIARVMLGNVLCESGEFDVAFREYHQALSIRRNYAEAWERAGAVLNQQGRSTQAIPYLRTAVQLSPRWTQPRRSLALALVRQGRTTEARTAYEELAGLMPPTAKGHTQIAEMLAEGQQFAEAVLHYREALRLNPDYLPALNNLAWLRATCAKAEWRDGGEAVQLAEGACHLSKRQVPHFLGALAAAYAEAGSFDEAVKIIEEARALAQASGATNLLPVHALMLQHFQAQRPFREGAP